MPTTHETVLAALNARLLPLAALVLRDEVLPERVPSAGLIILRDGQLGEPEITLSPHSEQLSVLIVQSSSQLSEPDAKGSPDIES